MQNYSRDSDWRQRHCVVFCGLAVDVKLTGFPNASYSSSQCLEVKEVLWNAIDMFSIREFFSVDPHFLSQKRV
jgi:hypothetical protein